MAGGQGLAYHRHDGQIRVDEEESEHEAVPAQSPGTCLQNEPTLGAQEQTCSRRWWRADQNWLTTFAKRFVCTWSDATMTSDGTPSRKHTTAGETTLVYKTVSKGTGPRR
eukprot:2987539-Rhodomonas_salina.3